MYKIVRSADIRGYRRTIKTGLVLQEAQEHCRNPETSGITGTSSKVRRISKRLGTSFWFDSFTDMK